MAELGEPERVASRYLALVDRLLPGRVVGFYLTGRPRSVPIAPQRHRLRRGRRWWSVGWRAAPASRRPSRSATRTTAWALRAGHIALPGTVNGCYVHAEDLTRPVTSIHPVATHVTQTIHGGGGPSLNPRCGRSSQTAGEYALDLFSHEWHPIIRDGLAFARFEPPVMKTSRRERIARAGPSCMKWCAPPGGC
jgi:hypothetical protein